MMTCSEARLVLEPFLDGELSPAEEDHLSAHLAACASCRRELETARALEAKLGETFRTEQPPAGLWERIEADFSVIPSSAVLGRPPGWRHYAAAAALALAIFGAALYVLGVYPTTTLQAEVMQESSEELATFIESRRVVDVASNDPREIRDWMMGKVAFNPPLPPQVSGLELVGGRLCYFLDRRIASYMYRSDDASLISLYVMQRRGVDRLEGELLALAGRQAALGEVKGFTNVIWFDNGLAYVLVSSLPEHRLLSIGETMVGKTKA